MRANRELIAGTNGKPAGAVDAPHRDRPGAGAPATTRAITSGVLPRNSVDLVRRVITRFGLDAGQYVTIIPNSGSHTHLPIDEPAPLLGVLGSCVELQDVAGRDDIATLARHTSTPASRPRSRRWPATTTTATRCTHPNRSLLDLLEAFPACALPFAEFLDMLPPLRPRYYSISSSPLASPDACSITVGVLRGPARSGTGTFTGIGSGYLAGLPENGTVFTFVRSPSIAFHPPENPHTPMIMIGAGTGLAPVPRLPAGPCRAAGAGRPGGPVAAVLRVPQRRGRPALRRRAARLRRPWPRARRERLLPRHRRPVPLCAGRHARLRGRGVGPAPPDAAVFVCGNASTIAPGVRSAVARIFQDKTGTGEADAQAWLAGLRSTDRFVEDIWGG